MNVNFRYVQEYVDDHGTRYIYYRRGGGRKVRIRATPGTAEFQAAYDEARCIAEANVDGSPPKSDGKPKAGTYRWLCTEYFKSLEFRNLNPDTQRVRRNVLEATWREPWEAGSRELFDNAPIARIDATALEVLRDRKLPEFPEAARSRLKNISQVFEWAKDKRIVKRNPARDVKYPKHRPSAGFHKWEPHEVEQFWRRHPIGTKARLAVDLLLFTGQRGSDIHQLGRQHIRDGWIKLTQAKNKDRNPVTLQLPVLPILSATIEATSGTGVWSS
jgi:integrase